MIQEEEVVAEKVKMKAYLEIKCFMHPESTLFFFLCHLPNQLSPLPFYSRTHIIVLTFPHIWGLPIATPYATLLPPNLTHKLQPNTVDQMTGENIGP